LSLHRKTFNCRNKFFQNSSKQILSSLYFNTLY